MALSWRWRTCAVIFFFIWYGIVGYVNYKAVKAVMVESSEDNALECLLIDYEASQCSYECNCESDGGCDSCDGQQFVYEAMVESKCENQTLFSSDLHDSCPMTLHDIGTTLTCYVADCDAVFTFESPEYQAKWGVILLCFLTLFFCICPLCVCVYCCSKDES